MCRGHNFIRGSSSYDGLSCTSLDGLGFDVSDGGVLGTTVRPCDGQSAGFGGCQGGCQSKAEHVAKAEDGVKLTN